MLRFVGKALIARWETDAEAARLLAERLRTTMYNPDLSDASADFA